MPFCSLNRLFDVHIWIHTHFTCWITYQINIYDAVNKSTLWQFIVWMQFLVACLKFQVVCNVAWGAFAHFPVFHLKIPSLPPDSCPAAAGRAITPQRHNTLSCICIHTAAVFVFILQLYLYSYCSCICIRAMESKSLEGNKSLKSRIWFAIGILENVLNPGCEGLAQSHKKFQFITLNEKSHRCHCIPNDHKSKGDPGPSKH